MHNLIQHHIRIRKRVTRCKRSLSRHRRGLQVGFDGAEVVLLRGLLVGWEGLGGVGAEAGGYEEGAPWEVLVRF